MMKLMGARQEDNDWRVVRVIPKERRRTLTEGIREQGRRYADLADLLFFDWPKAKGVVESLQAYLSDHIQLEENPVVYRLIRDSLDRYHDAVFNHSGKKLDDPLRLAIFIDALLTATCDIVNIEIENDQGSTWTITTGQPFSSWLMENDGGITIYAGAVEDQQPIREMLYALLTSDSIKRILKRAGHEDAVLANRLVIGC